MTDFEQYLHPGKRGYLIGIGGVSMSPLAEVLAGMGLVIDGSDIAESEKTENLRRLGIDVKIGHAAENLAGDIAFVVRTAAVGDDNPEVTEARRRGLPVFERADAWGALMRDYKNALCIAGTHGKTTTTSMCTHIMMAAEADPTVMIGGTLPMLSAGHRVGSGDTIILESCEYHDSFLSFWPTIAIVLDIEADHLDYFEDLEHVKRSFREFAARVPEGGHIVANADDENTMDALRPLGRELFTFGLTAASDVYAKNIKYTGASSTFEIWHRGRRFTEVTLHVPGLHNIKNALAATAACICLGVRPAAVKYGLAGFNGAGRRFEFKGRFSGADVYDDYAHHPGELKVLFDAIETLDYQRSIIIFQPHTYTRTKALFSDFARELRRPDVLFLTEIYAARETNTFGVSSADLAREVEGAIFDESFDEIEKQLREIARPGDIIITVGAGDVYKIGESLVK